VNDRWPSFRTTAETAGRVKVFCATCGANSFTILRIGIAPTRVVFAMARDGLLPRRLAQVSRAGVPVRTTLVTTPLVSTIAAFLPPGEIVALANAGTLLAFCSPVSPAPRTSCSLAGTAR
jgi:amino acid transporter